MGQPPKDITDAAATLLAAVREAPDSSKALDIIDEHVTSRGGSFLTLVVAALLMEVRGQEFMDTNFEEPTRPRVQRHAVSLRTGRVL